MRAQARMNSHKINKKTWHRQALPLKNAHLCRVNSFRFPEACITLDPPSAIGPHERKFSAVNASFAFLIILASPFTFFPTAVLSSPNRLPFLLGREVKLM